MLASADSSADEKREEMWKEAVAFDGPATAFLISWE